MKNNYLSRALLGLAGLFLSTCAFSQLPGNEFGGNSGKKLSTAYTRYKPHYVKGRHPGKDISLQAPNKKTTEAALHFLSKPSNPFLMKNVSPSEAILGNTRYDLQSNGAMQQRIVLFDDMSLSAVWTMGFADPNFTDRGTGYNYFDGSAWGPAPSVRIDNVKTGWPGLARWNQGGEIIVNHNGVSGLEILTRPEKGTGSWNEVLFQGPMGSPELSWPRVVTNGPEKNNVHLVALTTPVGNGGVIYNGMDGALVYSRSLNGGTTWDINNVQLPETGIDYYLGLGGDTYAFAEPRGDTLALLVGDKWFDVFLLKSTDNGQTWTKTMIFQHPYPKYDHQHTIITDTIWVCDATMAVAMDKQGVAHAFFGLMRVNNPDTTDEEYSYWPFTDGLVYWKEGDAPFTTLDVDSVYDRGNLVGWCIDVNGNDTVYGDMLDVPKYALSMTCSPTVTIDDENDIYLLMSSTMEDHDNGNQNYRHILARKYDKQNGDWGEFFDLTDNLTHNFHECMFPSIAAETNGFIHYVYQADEEPGLAVRGDEDPYGDNLIYYAKAIKNEFVGLPEMNPVIKLLGQNFPNPCSNYTTISFNLEQSAAVILEIRDMTGRLCSSKDLGPCSRGNHRIDLPLHSLLPGIYFYTLHAGRESMTKKMMVY